MESLFFPSDASSSSPDSNRVWFTGEGSETTEACQFSFSVAVLRARGRRERKKKGDVRMRRGKTKSQTRQPNINSHFVVK